MINETINATISITQPLLKPACFWYKWQYTGFLCSLRDWTTGLVDKFPVVIAWVLIVIVIWTVFKVFFKR